jgi:ankyrin repeat protein
VVKELVKEEADVHLQDKWGYTPLMAACEEGHASVVTELVKVNADVNLQGHLYTPLIAACKG